MDLPKKIITRIEQVPYFENEDDENEFWQHHVIGGELSAKLIKSRPSHLPEPSPRDVVKVGVWLNLGIRNRLTTIAHLNGVSNKDLIKQFIIERLYEEEKRLEILKN